MQAVSGAAEAAQAMALARAGQKPTEVIASLPPVLALAQANTLELGAAADTVSGALAGFGLEADQAGRVADVLTNSRSISTRPSCKSPSHPASICR